VKALEKLDRMQSHARNIKQVARIREERLYGSATALAGAIAAGAADAKYRADDGTDKKVGPVPVIGAVAALTAVAGLSDYVPGSFYVGMVGIGALSYKIGKYAHDKMVERQQAAK
jgi:hypothetical protein